MPRESEGRDAQPKGAEKPTGKETKHIAHITTHEVSTHTHTWLALGVFELPRARDPGHEPVGWRHGRRANNEEASGEVFPTGIPNPNFEGPRFQAGVPPGGLPSGTTWGGGNQPPIGIPPS